MESIETRRYIERRNPKLEVSIKKSIKFEKDRMIRNQRRNSQTPTTTERCNKHIYTACYYSIAEFFVTKSLETLTNVYNRESYNNYLHSQWNNQDMYFKRSYREYVVQPCHMPLT